MVITLKTIIKNVTHFIQTFFAFVKYKEPSQGIRLFGKTWLQKVDYVLTKANERSEFLAVSFFLSVTFT